MSDPGRLGRGAERVFPAGELGQSAAPDIGRVAAGAVQVTELTLARAERLDESGVETEVDRFNPDLQRRLDWSVKEALRDPYGKDHPKYARRLDRFADRLEERGLFTARELLCVGRDGLYHREGYSKQPAFPRYAEVRIRRRLGRTIPEIRLLEDVTARETATFCHDLREVPFFAVENTSERFHRRFGISALRISVQDVLDQGGPALVALGIAPERIDIWDRLVHEYAELFVASKADLANRS